MGHQIPWSWRYRWLWATRHGVVPRTKHQPSERAAALLAAQSSLCPGFSPIVWKYGSDCVLISYSTFCSTQYFRQPVSRSFQVYVYNPVTCEKWQFCPCLSGSLSTFCLFFLSYCVGHSCFCGAEETWCEVKYFPSGLKGETFESFHPRLLLQISFLLNRASFF